MIPETHGCEQGKFPEVAKQLNSQNLRGHAENLRADA